MNDPNVEQPSAPPEGESRRGGLSGYIHRQWHGKNSLAFAFWVNFILGVLLVQMGFIVFFFVVAQVFTGFLPGYFSLSLMNAADVCILIWSSVGVWRSAGVSIMVARAAQPPGEVFWGYAARVLLILLMVIPDSPYSIWSFTWFLLY